MLMGYLALIVAEVPRWISMIVEDGKIDFGTFKHEQPKTTEDLVRQFDENMVRVREVLAKATDETLEGIFVLAANGKTLMSGKKKVMVSSSINHLVHHRGQLTVYLRLNNIPVPSLYGPSADDPTF